VCVSLSLRVFLSLFLSLFLAFWLLRNTVASCYESVESKETVQESSRVRKQQQKGNSICADENGGEKQKENNYRVMQTTTAKKRRKSDEKETKRLKERERRHDTTRHERWQVQLRAAGVNLHGSFLTAHSSPFSATFSHSDAQP